MFRRGQTGAANICELGCKNVQAQLRKTVKQAAMENWWKFVEKGKNICPKRKPYLAVEDDININRRLAHSANLERRK